MKRYGLPLFFTIILLFAYHITIVQPQVTETMVTIMNDVWYKTGHQLRMSGAGAQGGGGPTVWGAITGSLPSQADLQAALDLKSPKASPTFTGTVSGVTSTMVGLGNVNNTSDITKWSATAILTNKQYVPRSPGCTVTANHIAPNADSMDVCAAYTFTAGLTVDNPTHTGNNPVDQQLLEFEFKTAASQTLTWGSDYVAECGLALPQVTTGDGTTYNRALFRYSTVSTKWCPIAWVGPDNSGMTTLTSSTTYTCPATSTQCEMQMTSGSGTLTVNIPQPGTPLNGQVMWLGFLCTSSQTFAWNAIFVAGPTVAFPTTCPADVTKWTQVTVRYSTVLTKWQLLAKN